MSVLSSSNPPAIEPIKSQRAIVSSEWFAGFSAIAIFTVMSVTMAFISQGFLEGDACSHYLKARSAFTNMADLLSVWGRPFCTALYTLPAHFAGRLGVRLTSLAVAIGIALITRSIANRQRWQWPMLALIFLLAQPLVFLHSFSELTELPFALLLALGFWAYQRRRFLLFALVIGMGPLSRPEGFGFLGLGLLALILHRRWRWIPVLLLPLVSWDYLGWRANGSQGPWWLWLKDSWPYSQESLYDRGPLLYFVSVLPAVISPFVFPAAVVGGWLCFKAGTSNVDRPLGYTPEPDRTAKHPTLHLASETRLGSDRHLRRCELLIVVLPAMIVIGHTLLYWLGKMASNGEVRYMMVVAPFWALLSARGWAWIFRMMDWKHPLLWAGFAAMLAVLVNRAWTVIPMDNSPDWREARQIAEWYKTQGIQKYPNIEVSHVGLQYYLLEFGPQKGNLLDWNKAAIDSRPPGTLLVWDRVGALFNSDAQRKVTLEEIRKSGWKPLKLRWTNGAGEWQFFVSEKAS
jgi:hypothetical protein